MSSKLTAAHSNLEASALKTPKRLMGFREWCEVVWKPRQQSNVQTSLNILQGTVHGRH